jgi:hypothetical protein
MAFSDFSEKLAGLESASFKKAGFTRNLSAEHRFLHRLDSFSAPVVLYFVLRSHFSYNF